MLKISENGYFSNASWLNKIDNPFEFDILPSILIINEIREKILELPNVTENAESENRHSDKNLETVINELIKEFKGNLEGSRKNITRSIVKTRLMLGGRKNS